MHNYFISIVIIVSLAFNSCNTMKNEIMAIDVLIIPSEEMYSQAIQLNAAIHENNPETIKLDAGHIPHITLLQCFIKEEELPKVNKALEGLFETIKNETLTAKSLFYDKSEEESFAMISIEKSSSLLELHKKTIEIVKPYIVQNGSEKAFVQNPDGSPIGESTLNYVPNFVEKYSYENFDPHISLGVAPKVVLDSLAENVFKPIDFQPASLSIYQLGDHGTAQKLLWKAE